MDELTCQPGTLTQSSKIGGMIISPVRLTPVQWLICVIAAIGFAFDLYEAIVLPVVLRPALAALGNLKPGNPDFNLWVGLLFYVPAAVGGAFGLLGGYLTDLFAVEKRTSGTLELYSFSSARHWTTASVRKGLEMASLATSQNTGNIFSTWKLAIRKKKYKMSSKW